MLHRLLATVLTLTLLTQAFVPASAGVSMAAQAAAPAAATAQTDAAMPCHGAAAEAAPAPALAPMPAMDCCGDGGDCGQCSAGCLSMPGLPMDAAVSASLAAASQHARPLLPSDLRAPPQERLRPPIDLTC